MRHVSYRTRGGRARPGTMHCISAVGVVISGYPSRVSNLKKIPVALSIAGSDSGGGAGIQADIKTFAAFGVHGTSVITCVTAQNPKIVSSVAACSATMVTRQMDAVFDGFSPSAVKTGMLFSTTIVRAVTNGLRQRKIALVIDPVMISTSGARLLQPAALKSLVKELLPMAALLMPNLAETQVLIGKKIKTVHEMTLAARALQQRFGCAILVKGGHLQGAKMATDVLFDGEKDTLFESPFVRGIHTHGTGCTYSAAITALLALGKPLTQAVAQAKEYISQAITGSRRAGDDCVLNWNANGEISRRDAKRQRGNQKVNSVKYVNWLIA
jgi:hydroxymethylpyrimidine/phosphomethylpyrimidine kinase